MKPWDISQQLFSLFLKCSIFLPSSYNHLILLLLPWLLLPTCFYNLFLSTISWNITSPKGILSWLVNLLPLNFLWTMSHGPALGTRHTPRAPKATCLVQTLLSSPEPLCPAACQTSLLAHLSDTINLTCQAEEISLSPKLTFSGARVYCLRDWQRHPMCPHQKSGGGFTSSAPISFIPYLRMTFYLPFISWMLLNPFTSPSSLPSFPWPFFLTQITALPHTWSSLLCPTL